MSKKYEQPAQAVAIADDLLYVIVAGVCLAVGTFGISTTDSPTACFSDIFGEETLDNLRDYFEAVDEAEATGYLVDVNPGLVTSAKRLKAQYKIPVEFDGSFYKYYDETGRPYVSESLPFAVGTYFFVENLDSYEYYEPTDSYVLTQESYNDILNAVKSVTKKVVNLGKGVVSWLLDAAKATAIDSVAAVSDSYYDKFGEGYRDSMYSIHGDATTLYTESFGIGLSLHGVLLELHINDSVYYGCFKADIFETLNNSYSEVGDISIFTNNMATSYTLYNPMDYVNGSYRVTNNTNGGVISGGDAYSCVSLSYNGSATCVTTSTHYQGAGDAISGDKVHIINNGSTANYVIGTVGADGTIDYEVVGESSSYSYVDSIAKGNNSVKVSGDVSLTDKLLSQVMDNNLTVEDINSQVAEVSDSVIAIDDSIKNGFESNNNWLAKIWSLLGGFPALIVSAFAGLFEKLWGYLASILSGILDIPGDIVSALSDVKDAVLNIPILGTILQGITDVKDVILDLPVSIADAIAAVGDFALDIPSDFVDVIDDIWETLQDIPGDITSLLKELLIELFVPSDTFFNNWKNDFNNLLVTKLPYDTYNEFFDDIKAITQSKLEDITITVYGKECTVLTFAWYYEYQTTIDHWIRGVMFIVLIFYNLNQMYKILRNTSLYKVDKYF